MELAQKQCVPCRGGIPALTRAEAQALLKNVPHWALSDDARQISRRFSFKNFAEALAFVNKAGVLADAEDHHPDITFGWGYVSIVFYTHKINGLHENDFIMAAKVDRLLA